MAHIPVGYVTLAEAFARFSLAKWGGHEPLAQLADGRFTDHFDNDEDVSRHHIARGKIIDIDQYRFLTALQSDELKAVYLPSELSGLQRVLPGFWSEAFFPERLFDRGGEVVVQQEEERWDHMTGHIPLVNQGALDGWISSFVAAQVQDERPAKPRRLLAGILLDLIDDSVLTSEGADSFAKEWLLPNLGSCAPLRQFSWEELGAEPEFPDSPFANQIPEASSPKPTQRETSDQCPTPKKRRGHASGIEAAVSVLWPDGLPSGLPITERNSQIFKEMKRQGTTTKASIDHVTFRRFFRRESFPKRQFATVTDKS